MAAKRRRPYPELCREAMPSIMVRRLYCRLAAWHRGRHRCRRWSWRSGDRSPRLARLAVLLLLPGLAGCSARARQCPALLHDSTALIIQQHHVVQHLALKLETCESLCPEPASAP